MRGNFASRETSLYAIGLWEFLEKNADEERSSKLYTETILTTQGEIQTQVLWCDRLVPPKNIHHDICDQSKMANDKWRNKYHI